MHIIPMHRANGMLFLRHNTLLGDNRQNIVDRFYCHDIVDSQF